MRLFLAGFLSGVLMVGGVTVYLAWLLMSIGAATNPRHVVCNTDS